MSPEELPGFLEGIIARVEAAAIPVAREMGKTYKDHLVGVTLHESGSHPPVTHTPAPPGRPPAMMTGRLAGSVTQGPTAGGGGVAETSVQPNTVYAATQEWGGVHHGHPRMMLWQRYVGNIWPREVVDIPERSYMRRAVAEEIASGGITRTAAATFEAEVWGA